MAELFEDIPWIRILGGEPLMHPQLMEILNCARSIFPDTELDLCTNGLLIPKMEDRMLRCFKENRITIHISGYPPTYGILDDMDTILRKYDLDYTILKREKFSKYYTVQNKNNPKISEQICVASGCRELYHGRLAKCSAVLAFEKLNQQYQTKYAIHKDEDWFDIHEDGADSWRMLKVLNGPVSACRYCTDREIRDFTWNYSKKEPPLQDYVLKEV